MLYIRMILIMLVTLYTSRVVLNELGVNDFGIYSAVAGFISMFAILSNSLTAAISRFITFEMGKGDTEKIRKIFSTSLIIQMIISGIVVLCAETVGLWFLNTQMNIPENRMIAANWVFQFSILTFVINLVSVPYNASIVAHERMKAFAYVGVFQALGTLLVAFLIRVNPIDRLVFYALLMALVAVSVRFLYGWYCKRNFEECHFSWIWEKTLIKQIFGFAGWNFFGASSVILRDQGVNVLLNIFCGPAVNAARGIAMQVSAAVTSFTSNFMVALNPQITKSYASNNREYMLSLVFQGARLSFYLILFLSLPILVETGVILKLWLHIVPDYTIIFVRLILCYIMIESLSYTMITVMLATGNIRNYQLLVGGCQMLNFPIAFLVLKIGYSPEYTIIIAILLALCCLGLRLYMLRKMVDLPVLYFLRKVLLNVLLVSVVALILPCGITYLLHESLFRFSLNVGVSFLSTGLTIYFIGCSYYERCLIHRKIVEVKNKLFAKR